VTAADGPVLTVVGIGADGWDGLTGTSRQTLAAAEVLLGAPRQLDLVPADATPLAERLSWPSPLVAGLPALLDRCAGRVTCGLASGDPMFHGIGTTLVRLLGAHRVRVLPHPSSASLACARLGWALDAVDVVGAVARPLDRLHPMVQPGRHVLVLGPDGMTPAAVGTLLRSRRYGGSPVTVLERLGAPDERVRTASASDWADRASLADDDPIDALNVVAIECVADLDAPPRPAVPGLPDDAYEHDGQLTKRDVRAMTLARLGPVPGALLWDIGGGAGSIAIEWARTHPACRAIAVERDPARAERLAANAVALGVPASAGTGGGTGVAVVTGSAPEVLHGMLELATSGTYPDAVFVGGGVTSPGVVEAAWAALPPGGRLVANAVTLESEQVIVDWWRKVGGDLTRVEVQRAAPVGGFTGWRPALPVTIWSVTKP
jgi:precorrin-6Y C5,15-methyltransferase (decarboxylating)